MSRKHVELAHEISTLYNWATMPEKDTISALSELQARQALDHLKLVWRFLDRRAKPR